MAIKIPGLKFFTAADAKARVFILIAAVVGISVLVYLGIRLFFNFGGPTGPSQVAAPPAGLQSVPGAQMTPEFYRAVVQANQQAAQQAQISGGSAVPTLINVPGQQETSCTIVCPPLDEAADALKIINDLVKSGKLPQELANRLAEMVKNRVTPEELAAALNDLVKQGKLAPADARKILEDYKKQLQNELAAESAKLMDNLIKSGQLPIDVATQLLTLQKNRITPVDYAAELARLAREGKLSPQVAGQLSAQYAQQRAQQCQKASIYKLRQRAQQGQITPDVLKILQDMQTKNVTLEEYSAQVNKLLSAGKMVPEVATNLIDDYKNRCPGLEAVNAVNALVAAEEAKCAQQLRDIAAKNKLPQETLNSLLAMQQRNVSPQALQAALTPLQQGGKLSADDVRNMMGCYQHLAQLRQLAQQLSNLQGANASAEDYTNALKQAVQAGILTPEQAAALLRAYQSRTTVPAPGALPTIETNIPGTEQFAQLQQRLAAEPAAPVAQPAPEETAVVTQQFETVKEQNAAAAIQARDERLQALATAMSAQAQSLVAAWQPPTMQRQVSQAESSKGKPGEPGTPSAGTPPATKPGEKEVVTTTTAVLKPPLIKSGTILYAVLDTAVDSDYPDTPVMATIVTGKFKGARLLGKLNLAQGMDRVSLVFSLMDMDNWLKTKAISAYAIDPDTARTVMASSVDHHYLLRYGSLFAASFLSGYANAIMSSGSVQTNNANGSTVTTSPFSPREKLAIALGQFGTALSNVVQNYVNTPTTVRVNSGVGLGILFIADVPSD